MAERSPPEEKPPNRLWLPSGYTRSPAEPEQPVAPTQAAADSPHPQVSADEVREAIAFQQPLPVESFDDRVTKVRKAGWWVAFAISLPTLSIQAIVVKALNPGLLGAAGAASIWDVFTVTAPLAVAVVLITLGFFWGWYKNPPTFFAVAGLALLLGSGIVSGLGADVGLDLDYVLAGSDTQQQFVQRAFEAYRQLYGDWTFLSSLLVGGFLAWAINVFVEPYQPVA